MHRSRIAQFTNGRFEPLGQLSLKAEPLTEDIDHPMVPLPSAQSMPQGDYLLLITPQDCRPEKFIPSTPAGVLGLLPTAQSRQSEQVRAFEHGAVTDAVSRSAHKMATVTSAQAWSASLIEAAQQAGTNQIITPWVAVGPVATHLDAAKAELAQAGVHLHQRQRTYDTLTWPHATKGYFKLKKKIPGILTDLGLADP